MKVIVVYDIPVEYPRLRDMVREFLKDLGGTFIQYSVYEADLDEEGLRELISGLEALLRRGGGKVDIFLPCSRCYSKIRIIDTY